VAGEPSRPRGREADRTQIAWRPVDLEGLALAPLYQPIRAVEGEAGRSATDPKLLLALWL